MTGAAPDGTGFPGLAAESVLLCDGCFEAAVGLRDQGEHGCPQQPGHTGVCLHDGAGECQWCGNRDRLHMARRADVEYQLPTVGGRARACGFCTGPTASTARALGAVGLGRLARKPRGPSVTGTGTGAVQETWTYGGVRIVARHTRVHAWTGQVGDELWFAKAGDARRRRQPAHGERPPLRRHHPDHRHPRVRRPLPREAPRWRQAAYTATTTRLHMIRAE